MINAPIPLNLINVAVCCCVPDAIFVKLHALSNFTDINIHNALKAKKERLLSYSKQLFNGQIINKTENIIDEYYADNNINQYYILNPSFATLDNQQNDTDDSKDNNIENEPSKYIQTKSDPNTKYPFIPSIKRHVHKIQHLNNKHLQKQSIETIENIIDNKGIKIQNEIIKINENIPLDIQNIQQLLFNVPNYLRPFICRSRIHQLATNSNLCKWGMKKSRK